MQGCQNVSIKSLLDISKLDKKNTEKKFWKYKQNAEEYFCQVECIPRVTKCSFSPQPGDLIFPLISLGGHEKG